MAKLIECVPNFSEGRNRAVIDALAKEAGSVPGVALLDCASDANHNRSVLTLTGDPEHIAEAAFRLCRLARDLIDLNTHRGEHPRMGASDVIPFIPVKDAAMEECVALSLATGERIWKELGIPVFLYEESARTAARRNLANIRKGQFEGMPAKLLDPDWAPDFGERKIHPTAGVTAVGARMPLIAFNVNLGTADLAIAKAIAKTVRSLNGGYAYCRAIGVMLEDRKTAQVAMNLVNHEGTPIYRVFEAIRFEAARWGVPIIGSELVGLSPAKALIDCAEYYLKIEHFDYRRQVLENHLMN
jgi:glutamate formiminotransferase